MNIRIRSSHITLAFLAALNGLLVPSLAQAQAPHRNGAAYAAAPVIESFSVAPLQRVTPGSELVFTLRGTPGADVSLTVRGAPREIEMSEVQPGVYQGFYTVANRDRVNASSLVTAAMRREGQVTRATLDQSVVAGAPSPAPQALAIANFGVSAPERIRPGDELKFSMTGTPGATASVAVLGVPERIALAETRPGFYEGDYTLRRQDKLRGRLSATAHLRAGGREIVQRYAGDANALRDDRRRDVRGRDPAPSPPCPTCGTVSAVNLIEVKNDGKNVIGTIAGGVLGGVLGRQVGGGTGKDIATVAGALGGAYAGNRVQDSMDKSTQHEVVVRLRDGTTRSFRYAADPGVKVGDPVRVENDALVRM